MPLNREKLHRTIHYVIDLLANRNFAELEKATDSIRMRAEEIGEAVDAYPGTIVSKFQPDDVDEVQIDTPIEECWSVFVRLHTDQESPSDLTASLTLIEDGAQIYRVELDDIHVL